MLTLKGFQTLKWRKGTGLDSSPSDSGRDIECQIEQIDPDKNKYYETWFVECKHYIKGVPPTKLQGILSWASAENPDVVLIIASNFLSNPAKDYIDKYEQKNKPRFGIKIWEKPDLERLTIGESRLLKKYRISSEFPFLSILNPAHLTYIKQSKMNSIDYFFDVLDDLDPKKRDSVLSWVYHLIIRPRYREAISENETLKDLEIDEVSYRAFRKKCYEIVKTDLFSQEAFVFLIVNFTLQMQFGISDTTSVDEFRYRMRNAILFFQERKKEVPKKQDLLNKMIKDTEQRVIQAQENIEQNYRLYEYFCSKVLSELLLENIYGFD